MLESSKLIYETKYKSNQIFKLNEEYSRKDVCKLIKLNKNQESVIMGGRIIEEADIFPIFVTYKKNQNIDKHKNHNDYFINRKIFHGETKNFDYHENKEINKYESLFNITNGLNKNKPIELFVKKSDSNPQFYYLGKAKLVKDSIKKIIGFDDDKKQKYQIKLSIKLELDNEIEHKLYEYFNN